MIQTIDPAGTRRRRRTIRRAAALAIAAACLGSLPLGTMPARASDIAFEPACAVPDALVVLAGRLDHVVARARSGAEVRVIAIGSSSTAGAGASAPDRTYPARLAVELGRRLPSARFSVANLGVNGEVSATTLARLKAAVAAKTPDLVVWQVGTNDAVRGVGADAMAATIDDGLAFLKARGVDVMLMDPQFYPRIAENTAYAATVSRIGAIGAAEGVPVLQRFAAMRLWASRADGPPMLWTDAFHMNDLGYACVASVLAEGIARRVEAADRSDPAIAAGLPGAAHSAPKGLDPAAAALTH